MEEHIVDEKAGIPYTLIGDYYFPYGDIPDTATDEIPIGIWGQRHGQHLRKHREATYNTLLLTSKLNDYLAEINEQAEAMLEQLIKQIAKVENITEQMKADNQMEWVKRMNYVRDAAIEIVDNELIYI